MYISASLKFSMSGAYQGGRCISVSAYPNGSVLAETATEPTRVCTSPSPRRSRTVYQRISVSFQGVPHARFDAYAGANAPMGESAESGETRRDTLFPLLVLFLLLLEAIV